MTTPDMHKPHEQQQSQDSVDSFAWQWTERTVFDSTATFYRRLIRDAGIWHDHLDGKDVAYVGSGNGRHVWALCAVTRARRVISVELAEASVRHQRRVLTDPRIEIIQGDAAQVAFEADFIYLIGVIQHTADPQRTLDRCIANLRDGGELLVSFYMPTAATLAVEPIRSVTKRLPKRVLWAISPALAPIFMARRSGREMGFQNAWHTAYDWFGSHEYQEYFTESRILGMFDRAGIHPRNVLRIEKGRYRVRKGAFSMPLDDVPVAFGSGSAASADGARAG